MFMHNPPIYITETVAAALVEDIGSGDVTAALIPSESSAKAQLMIRESAVICGIPWVNEKW